MLNANTDEDITNVFKEKYKEIYTSVPTDDMELETISQDINNLVLTSINFILVILHHPLLCLVLLV